MQTWREVTWTNQYLVAQFRIILSKAGIILQHILSSLSDRSTGAAFPAGRRVSSELQDFGEDSVRQPNDDRAICGRRRRPQPPSTAVLALILCAMLDPASAATDVQGRADEMQIRAQNASIREVLDALAAKFKEFKLTYKLPPSAGPSVTGVYSGSLNQVLARILDGNDYVVEFSDDGIKVVVLSPSGAVARSTAAPTIAADGNKVTPAPPTTPTQPLGNAAAAPSNAIPPLTSYLSASSPPSP